MAPRGRLDEPTAARECRPASPKTRPISDEAPLITCGCWVKVASQLTKPVSLTTRVTRSRSPVAALAWASRLTAHSAAASAASASFEPGGQPVAADRQLARDEQQVAGPHEGHVIGQRRHRFGQFDADLRQPRLDPSGHDSILPW